MSLLPNVTASEKTNGRGSDAGLRGNALVDKVSYENIRSLGYTCMAGFITFPWFIPPPLSVYTVHILLVAAVFATYVKYTCIFISIATCLVKLRLATLAGVFFVQSTPLLKSKVFSCVRLRV